MIAFHALFAAFAALLLACAPSSAARGQAAAQYSESVLVLHSYHPGFPWTDEIQAGILSEFRRLDPHFEPFVEYLDWKRFPGRESMERFRQSIAAKHAGKRFGVILVSDNAALDFALANRESLFGGAPIVFSGLNGYREGMFTGHGEVWGITEDLDVTGTVEAILKVLPRARRVIVPVENTETGQAQRAEFAQALRPHQDRVEAVFLDNPTIEEIFASCGGENARDSVVILGSFGRDRAGRVFPDFGVDQLSSGCDTPIFVLWDFLVGKGAVGGSVLSGKLQGREAAKLAIRVLAGEKGLPVNRTASTQLIFDQAQLKRFGIHSSLLPKGSLLVNEPVTIFQRYRAILPALLSVMVVMAVAIAVLSVSIAARRRAERELEKTKALLAAAIEHSPAGIMVAEAPDVNVTLANPAALRILGVTRDQAGKLDFLHGETLPWRCFYPDGTPYRPDELALTRAVREARSLDNVEMRILRSDGQECWVMVSTSPIRGRQGEVAAGISVFSDVTARKRMEELVVQSEKMVSLGGLAAGMAHEINNPLGIIVHSAQNALRRVSADLPANEHAAREAGATLQAVRAYLEARSVTTYLQDIMDAGHRASRIVRGMLGFSRPNSTERSWLKVNALVDKALELAKGDYDLKRNYDVRKISFVKEYDPADPSGMFVETEIIQVLLNIIKNAAQATGSMLHPEGSPPMIRLATALEGDSVRIDVEDNGPGMDERTCKRIMEPFFTTKQVGEGTGLGLSVTYFIVTNSYGGTLSVCSEPGKGATFTVRLPRGRGTANG